MDLTSDNAIKPLHEWRSKCQKMYVNDHFFKGANALVNLTINESFNLKNVKSFSIREW